MADIKTSRKHSLPESELNSRLENLAGQMKKKFGIHCDFQENKVSLSGSTVKKGVVSWTSDSLDIEVTLGLMAKMFKNQIKEEIEKQMDDIANA